MIHLKVYIEYLQDVVMLVEETLKGHTLIISEGDDGNIDISTYSKMISAQELYHLEVTLREEGFGNIEAVLVSVIS